jgi:uncharacterized Tic20 family protein
MNELNNNNPSQDDNKLACLFHLLYFANWLLPFSGIISLIVIRACRMNFSSYLGQQWREAVNFNISMIIYFLIFCVLVLLIIGIPLLLLLFLFSVIMPVIASIKTLDGQKYTYPFIIRII